MVQAVMSGAQFDCERSPPVSQPFADFQKSASPRTGTSGAPILLESLVMTESFEDIECVVIALVDRFVRTAVRLARDRATIADVLPDMPSAETWRNIANAIEQLSQRP